MFCRNCGEENDYDAKFCKKCGNPLGSNKTKQGTSKFKIIIPIAIIVVVLVIAGATFMNNANNVSSDDKNDDLDDTSDDSENTDINENKDLLEILSVTQVIHENAENDGRYPVFITIEFSPTQNIEYVRYLSLDNLKMIYNDGSSSENEHVDELRFRDILTNSSSSHYSKGSTNTLYSDSSYQFEFDTTCEVGKSISHIEGDIIAHTLTNGNITIGHIDNEVTMN